MKKLLMGSVTLLLFSISIMIFQISCKKEVMAVPTITTDPATVFQEGKILSLSSDLLSYYISNYDGSNKVKISIPLPAGLYLNGTMPTISPDHKTIFFTVVNSTQVLQITTSATYSCGIDGKNLKKVDDLGGWRLAL